MTPTRTDARLVPVDLGVATCLCRRHPVAHDAAYLARLTNADTGGEHELPVCFARGREFAERHGIEFPPWKE